MVSSALDKQELNPAGSLVVEWNSTDVANPAAGQWPAPARVTGLLHVTIFSWGEWAEEKQITSTAGA
jgi:hypothetical protein